MSGENLKVSPKNVAVVGGEVTGGVVNAAQLDQIVLDTPQQDSDWSEAQKLEWIKNSSAILLKVFNQP